MDWGGVYCCGLNDYGQLGIGNNVMVCVCVDHHDKFYSKRLNKKRNSIIQ